MTNLTIKNIPDGLYEELKQRAAANRRSINSEIIVIIEEALGGRPFDPDAASRRARILREKLDLYITNDEIDQAKKEGRP